jgi:hypothetical protein
MGPQELTALRLEATLYSVLSPLLVEAQGTVAGLLHPSQMADQAVVVDMMQGLVELALLAHQDRDITEEMLIILKPEAAEVLARRRQTELLVALQVTVAVERPLLYLDHRLPMLEAAVVVDEPQVALGAVEAAATAALIQEGRELPELLIRVAVAVVKVMQVDTSTATTEVLVLLSSVTRIVLLLLPQLQVHPQLQPQVDIEFINGLHPAQLLSKEKKCRTLQKLKMVSLHRLLLQNKT